MEVIIFYEHVSREYDGCVYISNALKSKYNINSKIFSIIFEYYDAVKYAKNHKVDMVIVPWLYDKKNYELSVPFIKLNKNLVVLNLHHEQIASDVSPNSVIPQDDVSKNNVIHLVWGEFFKELLIKNGVCKDLIFKTGSIRTDANYHTNINLDRNIIANRYGLDNKKKWILYSENRDWVWGNYQNVQKAYLDAGCSLEDFNTFYQETKASLKKTMEDINNLSNSFFEVFEIIYRSHPGTIVKDSFDSRIHIINYYSIYEWLKNVDVNIVSCSTTIFESDSCGIASFVDESHHMPNRFQTWGLCQYPKLQSLNELNEKLINENKIFLKKNKIYEQYIGIANGNIAEYIADIINSIANNKINYSNKIIKVSRIRYILKFFRCKAVKILYKHNLLEKIKISKMAIRMKNDIPSSWRKNIM